MWFSCFLKALGNQAKGFGDRLLDVEIAGVEQDCVGRLLQRRDRTGGVTLVSGSDVDQDIRIMRRHPTTHQLAHSALRPDFRRGRDE